MNKTAIEWCDYTINPVKGLCPMACEYCYARRMYKRFKWNPAIRFEPENLIDLSVVPKGSRVFIGSTIELFHEYTEQWLDYILDCVKRAPWQTSILLTKQPQNIHQFSPFPDNCWIGVTATNQSMYDGAVYHLNNIKAEVKFISLEPLLSEIHVPNYKDVDWLIIGAQTPYSPKTAPKASWVKDITDRAKAVNTAVFHKDNLGNIFDADGFPKRQEYP